jgi:hypothetical protein
MQRSIDSPEQEIRAPLQAFRAHYAVVGSA